MRLKIDFKVTALLNINVKIDVIIRILLIDSNLVLRQEFKLKFILYSSYSPISQFFGNVKVAIRGLMTRYLTFIFEKLDTIIMCLVNHS